MSEPIGWSVVRLTDKDISNAEGYRLLTKFEAVFTTALGPPDAAMFGNKDPDEDNNLFYFSPRAAEIFSLLLRAYSPMACEAPERASVVLLVGHTDARDRLL